MKNVDLIFIDPRAAAGDKSAQSILCPKKGSLGAAGFDLVAANLDGIVLNPGARALVPTGVAISLPIDFEAQIRPRSGLAIKYGIGVLNSPGTIDSDYRGEIKVVLMNHGQENFLIKRGMRIAQLVVAKVSHVSFSIVDRLSLSSRGGGGFGSTGMRPLSE